MRLVLIGFSGVGKSHWSSQLASERGYLRVCCDDLIEQKLSGVLPESCSGTEGVAHWMGHPYEAGYREREKQYLQCEQQVMEELLRDPEIRSEDNCVFDTTGSVIHCAREEQERLSELGLVVYLKADEETRLHLLQSFLVEPKPLIWGDVYDLVRGTKGDDLLPLETLLQEAFVKLLHSREKKYEQLADVVMNAAEVKSQCATASDLLLMIEASHDRGFS